MANGLPVSRVVNVSVSMSAKSAGTRNFGALLVLGASDVIDTNERLREYESIDDIVNDFGMAAEEYKAALLYYSAKPTPLVCYVGRWAKTATTGRLKGKTLGTASQAIANFTAINSGGFSVTIDGTVVPISSVNLTAVTNLNGVASAIATKLGTAGSCVWDGTRFVIKSATTGVTSVVTAMTVTPLSTVMGLNAGITQVDGVAAESLTAAIADVADMSTDWYGLIVADATVSDEDLIAAADFIEAESTSRTIGITSSDTSILDATVATDIASVLKGKSYNRSFVQYSSSTPYAAAAAFGRAFTVNFDGQNTTITLMFKTETGVTAEVLRTSQATALTNKKCNVFAQYDNDTVILQDGVMSGGWYFDERHGCDWMQNDVQTAVWNVLYTSTTKIPQTDAGVARLSGAVEKRLAQGVNNGLIAPGVWNGDDLGTVKNGDTLTTGFYVYAQPVADQSQANRDARKSPPIQAAIKLAGAVHSVDIQLTVNR